MRLHTQRAGWRGAASAADVRGGDACGERGGGGGGCSAPGCCVAGRPAGWLAQSAIWQQLTSHQGLVVCRLLSPPVFNPSRHSRFSHKSLQTSSSRRSAPSRHNPRYRETLAAQHGDPRSTAHRAGPAVSSASAPAPLRSRARAGALARKRPHAQPVRQLRSSARHVARRLRRGHRAARARRSGTLAAPGPSRAGDEISRPVARRTASRARPAAARDSTCSSPCSRC